MKLQNWFAREGSTERKQFNVLYREFLFRIISPDLLSKHAQGDSQTLLGQVLSLLVFCSLILALAAWAWSTGANSDQTPPIVRMAGAWSNEHFLIATNMLVVGVFAVLGWDSFFPDRRDALVLGPLPVRTRTLVLAKLAAIAAALGSVICALHILAGIAWPLAFGALGSKPVPALAFDAGRPPVRSEDFPSVMGRDIAPLMSDLKKAIPDGRGAIVIGVSTGGARRVMTYGAARADSVFEIGSVTKTFTGLLLAQMAVAGQLDLRDPVRTLLPVGVVAAPTSGAEITLLDLATHFSGLPSVPPTFPKSDARAFFTSYQTAELLQFIHDHGVEKRANTGFEYSNLGFALLGAALSNRAGVSFPSLVRSRITDPLRMRNTAVELSTDQCARFLVGHDGNGTPTPAWDLKAFASAGGLRSTAGDLLVYLEAQLHPGNTPFPKAIRMSQILRNYLPGGGRVALAWMFNPETGTYEHSGATGGFFAYVCFNPKRNFGAVVLMNAYPTAVAAAPFLGDHVRQRLAGEPAVSLDTVMVNPSGVVRTFAAYWTVMIASGLFVLCSIMVLQASALWLLPRRVFLRASAFLQIAIFSALVFGYFTLGSPASVLISGPHHTWRAMIPSYWFVGLYQQLSGSLHPALWPFACRAWIALAISSLLASTLYLGSYRRRIREILEEPDVAPALKGRWLPSFGNLQETAIAQFAIRGVLRSGRHRMVLSFYVGVAFAFVLLYLGGSREIAGPAAGNSWEPQSSPLLASTIVLLIASILGARKAFSLPLDLQARWMFFAAPLCAGSTCVRASRWAFYALSLVPVWVLSTVTLLALWPPRLAIAHLIALGLLGVVCIEILIGGVQRLPLCCSLLPGKSKLYLTFWLWFPALLILPLKIGEAERAVLQSASDTAVLLAVLGTVALSLLIWNEHHAQDVDAELRFEEVPGDELLTLRLSE